MASDPRNGSELRGRLVRVLIQLPSGSFSETDPRQNTLVVGADDGDVNATLRVVAKITKTTQKAPNSCELTINNLAPHARAALQVKGLRVIVEAGYVGVGLQRAFLGDSRSTDHKRDGADMVTLIRCGDGERAMRFARASQAFARGTTVRDVAAYCADQLGLGRGNLGTALPALDKTLGGGWTVHGAASSELQRILRSVGYSYSVQDGQLQVLAPGQSIEYSVPLISPETGLIGSPEMGSPEKEKKAPAIKFRSLLLPGARPGGQVHLRSERYDGIFKERKVEHSFDSAGGDWYTDHEAVQDPTAKVA